MKNLIFLIISNLCFPLIAQNIYTLNECVNMSKQFNKQIQNSKLKIQNSELEKQKSYTQYFPNLEFSGFGMSNTNPLLSIEVGPTNVELLENVIISGITMMQPIYSGGRISKKNQLSKLSTELSKYEREILERNITYQVEFYFWQIVLTKEQIKATLDYKVATDNLLSNITAMHKSGIQTKNKVLQVSIRSKEITSEQMKLDNDLQIYKMKLIQYMGLSSDSIDSYDIDYPLLTFEHPIVDINTTNNDLIIHSLPEYKYTKTLIGITEAKSQIKKSETLPSFYLGANYGYRKLSDKGKMSGSLFVTLSIPISNWWGNSYQSKKSKNEIAMAENNLYIQEENINIELKKSKFELAEYKNQLDIALSLKKESLENVILNSELFEKGIIDIQDLLDAQSTLQKSNINFIHKCILYRLKMTEYRLKTMPYS